MLAPFLTTRRMARAAGEDLRLSKGLKVRHTTCSQELCLHGHQSRSLREHLTQYGLFIQHTSFAQRHCAGGILRRTLSVCGSTSSTN